MEGECIETDRRHMPGHMKTGTWLLPEVQQLFRSEAEFSNKDFIKYHAFLVIKVPKYGLLTKLRGLHFGLLDMVCHIKTNVKKQLPRGRAVSPSYDHPPIVPI